MSQITRRTVLRGMGVSATTTVGVAGCLGRSSRSLESITLAYVPIYPNMQHYVLSQQGYYDALPVEVGIERFSSGPSVVKAVASGDVDAALFGITPAMVLADRGVEAAVLAANSRNGFRVIARADVADLYDEAGAAAFEQFDADQGRPVRFGAPPEGSVPDVVLRYWIEETLGLDDFESAVAKSTVPPARAVQTIQAGDIDATIVQEPFATIIAQTEGYREIAWSGEIIQDHPVTVLFASQRVIDAPEVARSLVEQHTRATEFVATDPEAAAADAASVIGSGVTEALARDALDSRASDFLSDPHAISDQTATMAEIVADLGTIDEPVAEDDLFAFEPYGAIQS